MRIEIEIPKEYEDDYNADRFSDFFSRAMIDIETMQGMCGRYEVESALMLRTAFHTSKVAYDVEAVVEQIKSLSGYEIYKHTFDLIIEIVRNGGNS